MLIEGVVYCVEQEGMSLCMEIGMTEAQVGMQFPRHHS